MRYQAFHCDHTEFQARQTCPGPMHYDLQEMTDGSIDLKCRVTYTHTELRPGVNVCGEKAWTLERMVKKS